MKKQTTLIDVVQKLQSQGHRVKFHRRKDGGIVITRINGISFRGKTGNVRAREMAGVELSLARKVQLERIRTPKKQWGHKKQAPLPKEIIKQMRKVQKEWRKTHPDIRGTISTSNVRYYYSQYGEEKTLEAIDKALRYAQGYAYIENVLIIIERINQDLYKDDVSEMREVIEIMQNKILVFKEEWIAPIYRALYDWERDITDGKECARIIKAIMM